MVKAEGVFVDGRQFVKGVIGIDTVDEGVADDAVEFRGPVGILITSVRSDDEEVVDAEFTQNEGVPVEKAVFEMLVGGRILDMSFFVLDDILQ